MVGVVDIVSRAQWRAAPSLKAPVAIDTPTPRLWLHHTAGNERGAEGMRAIQAFHQRPVAQGGRGWSDIAYSLVVDPDDLTVYEGRGIGIAGGHTKGDNSRSHAICVMGHFDREQPTPSLLRLLADLVRDGRERGWWGELTGGHRDAPLASTSCPGRHLYAAIAEIQALSHAAEPGDEDMPLNDADKKWIKEQITGAHNATREWVQNELGTNDSGPRGDSLLAKVKALLGSDG
jgi:hypothetical protein